MLSPRFDPHSLSIACFSIIVMITVDRLSRPAKKESSIWSHFYLRNIPFNHQHDDHGRRIFLHGSENAAIHEKREAG